MLKRNLREQAYAAAIYFNITCSDSRNWSSISKF